MTPDPDDVIRALALPKNAFRHWRPGVAWPNMSSVSRPSPLMCRNIRTLANFAPPATDTEVHDAALQFVRKLSGTTRPSRANTAAFDRAVDEVAAAARRLLDSLESNAPPKDRAVEAEKARERSRKRFGPREALAARQGNG